MNICRGLAILADGLYGLCVLCLVLALPCGLVALGCVGVAVAALVVMWLFPPLAPVCWGFIWAAFIGFVVNTVVIIGLCLLALVFWVLSAIVVTIRSSLGCP